MIRYKIIYPDLVCFLEFYPHRKEECEAARGRVGMGESSEVVFFVILK